MSGRPYNGVDRRRERDWELREADSRWDRARDGDGDRHSRYDSRDRERDSRYEQSRSEDSDRRWNRQDERGGDGGSWRRTDRRNSPSRDGRQPAAGPPPPPHSRPPHLAYQPPSQHYGASPPYHYPPHPAHYPPRPPPPSHYADSSPAPRAHPVAASPSLPRPPPPPLSGSSQPQPSSILRIGLPVPAPVNSRTPSPPPPPPQQPSASYLLPPDRSVPRSPARCAFVWLVMKGDSYTPGALTAAYSLRLTGSPHDTVCMVTPDVSAAARSRLSLVFSHVVEVEYISAQTRPLKTGKQQQLYARWVEQAFTKWACLTLTQYDKVCFLDADKIVLRNIDGIFSLPTPAATFSSPWASTFLAPTRRQRSTGLHNPYAQLQHGDPIPHRAVEEGLHNNSFVCIGTMVLLRPDRSVYAALMQLLAPYRESATVAAPLSFGTEGCHSMMDEQALCLLYHQALSQQWTFIHQRYNYICWHRSWLSATDLPYVFHFFNTKPWVLRRQDFLDLEAWWTLAHALTEDAGRWSEEQRAELRAAFESEQLLGQRLDGCAWCKESGKQSWQTHRLLDDAGGMQCPEMKEADAVGKDERAADRAQPSDGEADHSREEAAAAVSADSAVV